MWPGAPRAGRGAATPDDPGPAPDDRAWMDGMRTPARALLLALAAAHLAAPAAAQKATGCRNNLFAGGTGVLQTFFPGDTTPGYDPTKKAGFADVTGERAFQCWGYTNFGAQFTGGISSLGQYILRILECDLITRGKTGIAYYEIIATGKAESVDGGCQYGECGNSEANDNIGKVLRVTWKFERSTRSGRKRRFFCLLDGPTKTLPQIGGEYENAVVFDDLASAKAADIGSKVNFEVNSKKGGCTSDGHAWQWIVYTEESALTPATSGSPAALDSCTLGAYGGKFTWGPA